MYNLESLLRHTHWTQHQLQQHQEKRFREILRYAYDNVEFYHEKLRQSAIKPDDIRNLEDLNKLPVISRDELQKNADQLISKEFKLEELDSHSTSGSSGRPLVTYFTKSEDDFRKAKYLRSHAICGQRPWSSWVLIEPLERKVHLGRLQRLLRFYTPSYVSIFDDIHAQASQVQRLRPDVIEGYSNSLLLLAEEVKDRKLGISPKMVLGGAELIDTPSRKRIEENFNAPFYDQYASEEFQMIAWQCQERDQYHIDADSIILEFVDENGEEAAPGERGEIVCTSLFSYAMPFLRYRIGDVGVRSEAKSCKCGRTFPLMKLIGGRKDSVVILPDGRKILPLAFGWAMEFYKFYHYIYQYRIIQKRLNLLKIQVKKKHGVANETEMAAELIANLRKTLKINQSEVDVEVEFVESLPHDPSGKLRKVLSQIDQSS
jgi:phenylacetate-CoA ligase